MKREDSGASICKLERPGYMSTFNTSTLNRLTMLEIPDARKRELLRFGIDITYRQGTRLGDSGSIREANYTFFWQGLLQNDPKQHGVAIAVNNSLITAIEPPPGGSEIILVLHLLTSLCFANLLCIYTPPRK